MKLILAREILSTIAFGCVLLCINCGDTEIVLSRPGYSFDLELPPADTVGNVRTQDSLLNLINGEHDVVYWETFPEEPTYNYHTVIRLEKIEEEVVRLQTVDTANNQYPANVELYFRRVENKYSPFMLFFLDTTLENSFANYMVLDFDPTLTVGEEGDLLTSSIGANQSDDEMQISFNIYTFSIEGSDTTYRSRVSIYN